MERPSPSATPVSPWWRPWVAEWPLGFLVALLVLAAIETVAAWRAYRLRLSPAGWEALGAEVAALSTDEPVFLATTYLAPLARMHVPRLAQAASVAPPDLRDANALWVVGLGDDAWSTELEADRFGQTFEARERREAGPFTLTRYEDSGPPTRLVSRLVDELAGLTVETSEGACIKQKAARWKCKDGEVRLRFVEVDYRPRYCFAVDVRDGARVVLRHPALSLGNVLRGHVGFDDFNRRLRSDAPVGVALRIDGRTVARYTVTDAQGFWPFAVVTPAGVHEVAIEFVVSSRGTWNDGRYEPGAPLRPCLELRAFDEAVP